MRCLMDFFSLRPIWTRRCLDIVWYVYCIVTLIQLALLLSLAIPAMGSANAAAYFSFALQIAHSVVILLLVRIFLKMGAQLLIKPPA